MISYKDLELEDIEANEEGQFVRFFTNQGVLKITNENGKLSIIPSTIVKLLNELKFNTDCYIEDLQSFNNEDEYTLKQFKEKQEEINLALKILELDNHDCKVIHMSDLRKRKLA